MRGSMGDVVFAPYYEVLKRRGVRFEFFHRLENVHRVDPARLAPGERPYLEALDFDVQAEVKDGGEHQPLVDGERLEQEAWKFESHWERRKAGTRTLRVGQDFDLVVLAVGGGAVRHACGDLVEADSRWRDMVEHVKTVPTQAVQLWLSASMRELGWHEAPINLSGFITPFDTWADMAALAPEEGWARPPQAIAY